MDEFVDLINQECGGTACGPCCEEEEEEEEEAPCLIMGKNTCTGEWWMGGGW